MPIITNDDIKRLAGLSRLQVEEGELEGMRNKIGSVLSYVEKLQELDTAGVPEIANGAGETNTFREDVPVPSSEHHRLVAAFPRRLGDLMEAPAAISRKE